MLVSTTFYQSTRSPPKTFIATITSTSSVFCLPSKEAVAQIGAEGGSIVNIGSVNSTMGIPGSSVYAGTKGALNSITLSLSKELGPRKIRVNAINPGLIEPAGTQSRGFIEGKTLETVLKLTPPGRIGQPEDIGRIAAFLAS